MKYVILSALLVSMLTALPASAGLQPQVVAAPGSPRITALDVDLSVPGIVGVLGISCADVAHVITLRVADSASPDTRSYGFASRLKADDGCPHEAYADLGFVTNTLPRCVALLAQAGSAPRMALGETTECTSP